MSGLPAVTLEIAFASQPGAATQVWTDVSAWLVLSDGVEVEHGRGDEYDDPQPDRLSFTLRNDDGRFTPGLATSPYFPGVAIGRQVRLTLTAPGGTARTRFTGRVARWPVRWVGGTAKTVRSSVLAVGKLALLGRVPLRPAGQEEILRRHADLAGYWVLDEPETAQVGSDTSGAGQYPLVKRQIGGGNGTLLFARGDGPGPDRLPAPVLTPAAPGDGFSLYGQLKASIGVAGNGTSALVVYNPPGAANVNGSPIIALEDRSGSWVSAFLSTATTAYQITVYDAKTGQQYNAVGSFGPNRDADQTVTITVGWQTAGVTARARVYYGPILMASVTWPTTVLPVYNAVQAGGAKGRGQGTNTGTFSNVAVFDRELTGTEAGDINFALINSGDAFQVWVWWQRLLEQRGELLYGYQGLAYTELIGPQPVAGKSLPEALQQVARTVGALSYAGLDGRMFLQLRDYRYNRAADLTVSGSAGYVDAGLDLPGDDALMANDVTASSENGVTFRETDDASIAEYGLYPATISGLFRRAPAAQSAAQGRVSAGSSPRLRVPNLTFDLLCTPAAVVNAVHALTIGQRVQVTNMPAQSPVATLDLFVEGWTETVSATSWRLSLNTSPADRSDYWIVNDPVRGVVNSTNRVAW